MYSCGSWTHGSLGGGGGGDILHTSLTYLQYYVSLSHVSLPWSTVIYSKHHVVVKLSTIWGKLWDKQKQFIVEKYIKRNMTNK